MMTSALRDNSAADDATRRPRRAFTLMVEIEIEVIRL